MLIRAKRLIMLTHLGLFCFVLFLTYIGGPHITGLAKSMHVRSTAETSLPCTVSGDEPLSIIWSKDGILVPLHDERYVAISYT